MDSARGQLREPPSSNPYISLVGSAIIARNTSCVGNVIRGPLLPPIQQLYLAR